MYYWWGLGLNVTGFSCCTKSPSLLLFESVQSSFLTGKHCCLHLLLLSLFFKFHFILYTLPDNILGGQITNIRILFSC